MEKGKVGGGGGGGLCDFRQKLLGKKQVSALSLVGKIRDESVLKLQNKATLR